MTPAELRQIADYADTWKLNEDDIVSSVLGASFIIFGLTKAIREAADEIERLQSRLKAAEAVCNQLGSLAVVNSTHDMHAALGHLNQAIEAWREARCPPAP